VAGQVSPTRSGIRPIVPCRYIKGPFRPSLPKPDSRTALKQEAPSPHASRRLWRTRSTRFTARRSPSTVRTSTCLAPATKPPRSRPHGPLLPLPSLPRRLNPSGGTDPFTRAQLQELDEMKRRLKEMEEEAAALREMQAKVAKEMQG
jgi:hypothetical protein